MTVLALETCGVMSVGVMHTKTKSQAIMGITQEQNFGLMCSFNTEDLQYMMRSFK